MRPGESPTASLACESTSKAWVHGTQSISSMPPRLRLAQHPPHHSQHEQESGDVQAPRPDAHISLAGIAWSQRRHHRMWPFAVRYCRGCPQVSQLAAGSCPTNPPAVVTRPLSLSSCRLGPERSTGGTGLASGSSGAGGTNASRSFTYRSTASPCSKYRSTASTIRAFLDSPLLCASESNLTATGAGSLSDTTFPSMPVSVAPYPCHIGIEDLRVWRA